MKEIFNIIIGFAEFQPEKLYSIPSNEFYLIVLEGNDIESYLKFLKKRNKTINFTENPKEANKDKNILFLDKPVKKLPSKKLPNTIILTTDERWIDKANGLITISPENIIVNHFFSKKETTFQYRMI